MTSSLAKGLALNGNKNKNLSIVPISKLTFKYMYSIYLCKCPPGEVTGNNLLTQSKRVLVAVDPLRIQNPDNFATGNLFIPFGGSPYIHTYVETFAYYSLDVRINVSQNAVFE